MPSQMLGGEIQAHLRFPIPFVLALGNTVNVFRLLLFQMVAQIKSTRIHREEHK